jgi:hypothetical protein
MTCDDTTALKLSFVQCLIKKRYKHTTFQRLILTHPVFLHEGHTASLQNIVLLECCIYPSTVQRLLYTPPGLISKNSTFCPQICKVPHFVFFLYYPFRLLPLSLGVNCSRKHCLLIHPQSYSSRKMIHFYAVSVFSVSTPTRRHKKDFVKPSICVLPRVCETKFCTSYQ